MAYVEQSSHIFRFAQSIMCLYPKLIINRKYIANKKNGGNIPEVKDPRVLYVPVGCGKCMECLKQKARNWQVRLHEEIKHDKTGKFITFTFSNQSIIKLSKDIKLDGYNLDNEIATKATRRFLERWRKKFKKSVKHWFVTELGQNNTERIHIHGLLFTNEKEETINKIWNYGNIYIGNYVNGRTINYIVKYVHKCDELHKNYTPKILTSPGIGKGFITSEKAKKNKFKKEKTIETYKTPSGNNINLPIYYRNHLYSDEEKEQLWLQKLDENIRWVNGIKIDISKGEEEYYKVLKEEQAKNKRLGYGDNSKNWELIKYERERRNLKFKEIRKKSKNN